MGLTLLCGIPSETPLAMVGERLDSLGAPYVWFNQRAWDRMDLRFQIASGQVTGLLQAEGRSYRLEDFSGVYMRLMDDQLLPELQREPPGSVKPLRCRALHAALTSWCELSPARVLNRVTAMASNGSKPYQSQLIQAQGFAVPETLITNEPERVREFWRRHGKVIYKSLSGVRSIVQLLQDQDGARLEAIRWCPTQFQAYVEGTNVRVHVIAGEVFATAALTDATDYRYAHRQGGSARLEPFGLPDELAERCVRLAQALRLEFAGIDLKLAPDGRAFCFEVNPSPAFSFYEGHTGQPIAAAVARALDRGPAGDFSAVQD